MKIGRNEWFLGLFLVGVALIILSRFVPEGPALPQPEDIAEEPPTPVLPEPLEPASRPGPSAAASRPESRPGPGRQELDLPRAPALLLRGLVVDLRGVPLAGARVEALERPPARPDVAARRIAAFLLDLQGRLRRAQGREELDTHALTQEAIAGHVAQEFLPGRGEPHTRSGPDGRFRLGPLAAEECWLWACTEDLAMDEPVLACSDREYLLMLGPAGKLAATVLDSEGRPVPHCPVHLIEAQGPQQMNFGSGSGASLATPHRGETGADGRCLFPHLPLPGPYLAVARPASLPPVAGSPVSVSAGRLEEVSLRLVEAARLKVTARDEQGQPLAGVRVTCQPLSLPLEALGLLSPASERTDAAGEALLDGLAPGECQVHGLRLGREPALGTCRLEPGRTSEFPLILPAGISVVGQVTGEGAGGLADALVGLVLSTGGMGMDLTTILDPAMLLDPASVTRADRSGAFLLGGLPDRAVTLMAWAPGYAPKQINNIRPRPGRTVHFKLQPAGGVAGTVLDPAGRPVPRFEAQLWQEAMMGMRRLVASGRFDSQAGAFLVQGLAAGEYILRIEAPSHPPAEVAHLGVDAGETVTLVDPVRLAAGAALGGEVRTPEGRPAPGVPVRLLAAPAQLLSIPGFSSLAPSARTDPEGRFRFDLLPAGAWLAEARAPGLGVARSKEPIELAAGQSRADLTLVLERPAGIRGIAYKTNGEPDPGLRLLIQRTEAGSFRQLWTSTDTSGRFSLSDLEPGLWQAIAMGGDLFKSGANMHFAARQTGKIDLSELMQQPRIASVKLAPGETGEVVLGQPGSGGGTLLGTVRLAGEPLAGAMVTALRKGVEEPSPQIASTDKSGAFRLERLPAGAHAVIVMAMPGAGRQIRREALIEEGAESRLEIDFGGGVLLGRLVPQGPCGPLGNQLIVIEEAGGKPTGFALSDGEGRFRLEGVGAGTYRAFTEALPGAGARALAGHGGPVTLSGDHSEAEIVVEVHSSAQLAGTVEGPGSLREVRVVVDVKGWPRTFQAGVDADGGFLLHGLPPGPAQVTASSGARKARLDLLLVSGEKHQVVLPLRSP